MIKHDGTNTQTNIDEIDSSSIYPDFLYVRGLSLFLLLYIWGLGDISPMSMAYSYVWVVDYIWLICHDTWLMTHDIQLNYNRSWLSEATTDFWADESSAESQDKALKTTLGPIEASRAAIHPIESPRGASTGGKASTDWISSGFPHFFL